MKKWLILASVLALIALVATPLSVMAAGQDTTTGTTTTQAPRVHLAIVQPWVVRVGQSMQLTVFERLNQTPISTANVWTITKDRADTVRQAVQALNAKGLANVTEKDYEDILNANGTLLGLTDANGRLTHTFIEPADYFLVAAKDGYLPGYSRLVITEGLAVSAPKKAAPGDIVTISVDQKGTTDPISGAHVWAVDFSNAKTLKDKLSQLSTANKGNLQNADWDTALSSLAVSLGTTDANGQVTHSFDKGRYLLITTLKGCVPAYTSIAIVAPTPTPSPTMTPSTTTSTTGAIN
jgi:hypothetical protein